MPEDKIFRTEHFYKIRKHMATIRAEPVSAPSFCAGSNQENAKKLSEVFKTKEKYDIMPRKK